MNAWLAAGLRWADRVEHACGVLLAGGVGQPDPAMDDLITALIPDAERLGAGAAATRLAALGAHVGARRGMQAWDETHGLMAWIGRYRRELQHASLRASLVRGEDPVAELGADADLVILGVLPAGRRWFAHGVLLDGAPVLLVDEVRGAGDLWNTSVISTLFQSRVVPAEVWGGVLRLPAGHPTERVGGRVVARPAFSSRPQIVAGALRPPMTGQRLRARREGEGVVATVDRGVVSLGELATWNLWKAAGIEEFEATAFVVDGVLVGVEGRVGPAFVAVDPRALPCADWRVEAPPPDLEERVAALLGGAFEAAFRGHAFESPTRDADVAGAAARVLALKARGGAGADEALAAALGRVARGQVSASELLALDIASPGILEQVPPERLRQLAMSASASERRYVGWVFARAGKEGEIG